MKILKHPAFLFFTVLIGTEPGSAANPAPAGKDTTYLNLGGALRFNAFFKNWKGEEDNQHKTGDLKFDTWRINADGRSGAMSIYDSPYQVAEQGQLYIAGISYRLPVDWGPVKSLTFYNDFTFFDKQNQAYSNSQMNVGGVMAEIGYVYAYLDAVSGQRHPWIGPAWSKALSRGPGENATAAEPAPEWATRFNLNVGYYF